MKTLTTLLFVSLALVGCSSSAQFVRKDSLGGRVALQGAYMPAMADARLLMTEHCDGRYATIETEGAIEFRCDRTKAPSDNVTVMARASRGPRF